MTSPTPPAHPGRPPLTILLNEIEQLAGLGLTAAQVADRIGVSRRTLFTRMEADPSIREAMDRGLAVATERYAGILAEKIRAGDTTALIFWLKAKAGWTTVQRPAPEPASDNRGRPMTVTLEHCDEMMARQAALFAPRDRGD